MKKQLVSLSLILLTSSAAFANEAAGHESASLFSWDMAYKTANFLGLLFLLHYFAKKPLTRILNDIVVTQKDDFLQQRRAAEEAERSLEAFKTQMAEQETQLEKNRQHALASIEAEKAKIIQAAEEQAKNIEASAQLRITQNLHRAETELREFLAAEATDLAEGMIKKKLDNDEQAVLFDSYSNKLSQIS